jgi:hypothetical protein
MTDRRPIPGFEGRYTISSNGLILNRRGYVVFSHTDRDGYEQVRLYGSQGRSSSRVHRLVCEAFHGPCPDGQECAHLNSDKQDNRAENLAWVTRSENQQHNIARGVRRHSASPGEGHHAAKLTEDRVTQIRAAVAAGQSQRKVAREFGIS